MEETYSKTKEGITETWDVSVLQEIKQGGVFLWKIPESFVDGWTWGGDHISDHLYGCLKADLSRPILIVEGEVVDGCHRVCKALALGYTYVKAIDLTGEMPSPCKIEPAEDSDYASKWVFGDMVACLKSLFRLGY